MERPPAPSGGFRLYWPVIFDRGAVTAPRGFATREEAVVFATLRMASSRVEVVEATTAAEAIAIARSRPG
jgi:hypothetical protein